MVMLYYHGGSDSVNDSHSDGVNGNDGDGVDDDEGNVVILDDNSGVNGMMSRILMAMVV